jgi:PAS domain S-box-containing protein
VTEFVPQLGESSHTVSLRHQVVRALSLATDRDAAVRCVLEEVATSFRSPLAILWLLDTRTGLLRWSHDWSDRPALNGFREVCRRLTFASGTGLPGRAVETLEPAAADDIAADQLPRTEAAERAGLRSAVAVPLLVPEGAIGVIEVFDAAAPLTADQVEDLATAAYQLAAFLAHLDIEARLRASQDISASVFRAALDCVVTMDHTGRIVDFNPAAEATFGYNREEVIGDVLAERIIPPDLREAHRRAFERYVDRRESKILNRRVELRGMRADGSTFPVELTVTRLGSTEPPIFAGFIRDITERHQGERERDRLLAEAVSARARSEAASQREAAARAAAERARADAEAAVDRLAILARASEKILAIRDYEHARQQVVEMAVPDVADWCVLGLCERGRVVRNAAGAHRDPTKRPLVQELVARDGRSADTPAGAAEVVCTGRTQLVERVTDRALRLLARDEAHLRLLRTLSPRALLTVPLKSPRGVFGALTLAMAESGRAFEPDDVRLAESLAARAALALENARMFGERSHIAQTLQQSLLPPRLPAVRGLDLGARYRPAGEANLVGGDFYDFFPSGDGVWTVIIGDVAGKGPEAAAVTALTRHTLRAAALRAARPVESLRLLNEALLASGDGMTARFASVVVGRVCPSDDGALITVSVGGHPPPLVVRAGTALEEVDVRGTVIGAVEQVEVDEVDVRLAPGDVMLLYTDGVIEVRTDRTRYGERLLHRTLREHAQASAEEIVIAVERAAVEAQTGEPRDDIALLALRCTSATE